MRPGDSQVPIAELHLVLAANLPLNLVGSAL